MASWSLFDQETQWDQNFGELRHTVSSAPMEPTLCCPVRCCIVRCRFGDRVYISQAALKLTVLLTMTSELLTLPPSADYGNGPPPGLSRGGRERRALCTTDKHPSSWACSCSQTSLHQPCSHRITTGHTQHPCPVVLSTWHYFRPPAALLPDARDR